MATVTAFEPARPETVQMIRDLLLDRDIPVRQQKRAAALVNSGEITQNEALALVRAFVKCERKPEHAEVTPGFYQLDNEWYRVRISKTSGRAYAELVWLEGGQLKREYARGVIFKIRAEHKMSPAQVKRNGLTKHVK